MDYEVAKERLARYGQEHVLRYYDNLKDSNKEALLAAVEKIDFSIFSNIIWERDKKLGELSPCDALSLKQIKKHRAAYEAAGLEAIRAGKVGAVLLAGGQGTRLGWSGPKGTYNMGEEKELSIFACQMHNLVQVCKKAGVFVHLFIMTSDITDAATREFFETHEYFGYEKDKIHFYVQAVAPAISFDGKILMEERYMPVFAPNGNGGWFTALEKAGMGRIIRKNGIEWLNVYGVDNVLQRICDPVFVGATISSGSACGSKVVSKVAPDEKVGVLCKEDGISTIVEYYEMPERLKIRHDINGELTYRYGVILNYLFNVEKLRTANKKTLPYHLAKKKIPCIKGGKKFEPEEPNGYKLELLAVDLVKLMGSCLAFEVEREKEFAPVKNRTGNDSVDTARELLKKNGFKL